MISKSRIRIAKLRWLAGGDDCVSKCLSKKSDEGKEIDDQAIAICFSECDQSKESKIKKRTSRLKKKLSKLKKAQFTSQDPGSADFHHFETTSLKRKGYPNDFFKGKGAKGILKLASQSADKKYAKYYLLASDNINGNGWGVTNDTIPENILSFVNKPFVITAKDWVPESPYEDQYDHPFIPTNDLNQIFAHQERFRVGNIERVAKDEDGKWYAMIAIDEKYRGLPLPPFCSPAIYQLDASEEEGKISKWLGLHLAGLVEDPAYGPRVAILRGSCVGDSDSCASQFKMARLKTKHAVGLEEAEIEPIKQVDPSGVEEDEDEEKKKKASCPCIKRVDSAKKKLAQMKKKKKKTY